MMWKRLLISLFTLCCLTGVSMATTLVVDGPGDGDGANGDEYDSIDAAIAALKAANQQFDDVDDVINITVPTLFQSNSVYVNGNDLVSTHTDNLTINGNGCVITFAEALGIPNIVASPNHYFFGIDITSNQTITLNDFTAIPEFLGAGALTTPHGCLGIDEANDAVITNSTVNLNNVVFTASTTGNTPVDPNAAAPADVTRNAQNVTAIANVTWLSSPLASTGLVVNMTDCVVAHGFRNQIIWYQDSSTPNSNFVNMTRCLVTRGTAATAITSGMTATTAASLTVNIADCEFSFNNNHGIAQMTGAATAGQNTNVNVLQGTVLQNNGFRGLDIGANETVNILGTEGNPVIIRNNGNRGVRTNSGTAGRVGLVEHCLIYDNAVLGWEFNEVDLQGSPPVFNKVLFSQNGSIIFPLHNFRLGDTNAVAGTITFNDCTFHNVGNTPALRDDAATSKTHLLHSFAGSDLITYDFNRCIFSDDALNDDIVFDITVGDNNTVNLNNCGLVTAGPNRLNGNPAVHLTALPAATGNTFNTVGGTGDDPQYLSTTPGDVHGFFVSGDATSDYNNGGSNISGAGKFAPIIEESALVFAVDGSLAEWFADVAPASGSVGDFIALGSNQAIYQDPTGDNLGGGAYTSPTDGAFANTSVDLRQVRVAHDATKIYFGIEQHGSGAGFGANFETQAAFVALNYDGSGANQFVFQDGKITMRPELTHDTHLMLGETGSGLQTAGNTAGALGAQDESVNAFEFAIDKSVLTGNPVVLDLIVGLGHAAGSNFRQVNTGAAGGFDGGGGVPGALDADNVRIYDLAGAEGADSQTADWNNADGPFSFPQINASYLTVVLVSPPASSVGDWLLHD